MGKNLGTMVVNRYDYEKVMAFQCSSDRNTYDIITKEEACEHLLEATGAFLRFNYQKDNYIDGKIELVLKEV